MKKLAAILISALMLASLAACGSTSSSQQAAAPEANNTQNENTGNSDSTEPEATPEVSDFDYGIEITVVSREDGSGTRGAFIELFGIEEKDGDGNKIDRTTVEANFTNSTSVMMATVAGDEYAIGYISLGSLDSSIKALKINGVEATVDNIKDGSYEISRPFNIAVTADVSDAAQDFIDYIMSAEGQAVIAANGYIGDDSAAAFAGGSAEGKVVVGGSSSVSPVMEKLIEAYAEVNQNVSIELQTSDSSAGMTNTISGVYDIGMASRELKDSELDEGLTPVVIGLDGIAVIVNNSSPINDLSTEQVKSIFVGDELTWASFQ